MIALDQFSYNMFRNLPESSTDDALVQVQVQVQVLVLAQTAVADGYDKALSPSQRSFLYLHLCTANYGPFSKRPYAYLRPGN